MKLRDIMTTRIRSLQPDDSLQFARGIFVWSGIRHAPVVENGDLVGLLTDRDLAWHIARSKIDDLSAVVVAEAMITEVRTAGPDDGLSEAAARMAEHKIGCLPITEKGDLLGLVTTTDILTAEVRESMEPTTSGATIADVMTSDPVTVRADDHLVDAAAKMQRHRIRHLPVVDASGRPIGMLSDRDVRGTVGDLRRAGQEVSESVAGYRVSDAMSAPVVSVTSKSSLNDAVRRFCDFEIGAVAVVGEDEGLVGICSYLDLLEGLAKG